MFVPNSKKGAAIWNALILLVIVFAGVAAVNAFSSLKPQTDGSYRSKLSLKKK